MIGPIVDSGCLLIGGLLGGAGAKWIPERVKTSLPLIFGVVTIAMGANFSGEGKDLPVVVLAMIVGTLIGEVVYLEKLLTNGVKKTLRLNEESGASEHNVLQLITLITAFCFGSMGIFGAIQEGVTGNPTILMTKGVLDFFTAMIFSSFLGVRVALIAIPQFLILLVLYFCATWISPLMMENMVANFSACGGIIFLATGMRLCNIKLFPVVNMLPALLIVCPLTAFWTSFM